MLAAAALAWVMLPGVSALANRMHSLAPCIDEIVASQLWIEVRNFPWQRRHKVSANLLHATRAGVLRECDQFSQLDRSDRTWAHTSLFASDSDGGLDVLAAVDDEDIDESPADEELLEVLEWGIGRGLISESDRLLLLHLVEAAAYIDTARSAAGLGGFTSPKLASAVAPRLGLTARTVRRHAARSVHALATAAHEYWAEAA